ncbi:hypothetical protein NMG60_11000365 [Bertholletia excelsa]
MEILNKEFLRSNPSPPPLNLLAPWLSNSNSTLNARLLSLSVTLSLSSATVLPPPFPILRLLPCRENLLVSEIAECCKDLEEGLCAWVSHKKGVLWRIKNWSCSLHQRRLEKMEEKEAKLRALREEQTAAFDRIEAQYREQLAGLRRDMEVKEQKLVERLAEKLIRLMKFLEQIASKEICHS